jgi:hypothetical protein
MLNQSSLLYDLDIKSECEFTRQIVLSNICKYLKTLEFNLIYSHDFAYITQLENIPVLEHFRLTGLPVTLMDLEILYTNLPTMKSLHLDVHLASDE